MGIRFGPSVAVSCLPDVALRDGSLGEQPERLRTGLSIEQFLALTHRDGVSLLDCYLGQTPADSWPIWDLRPYGPEGPSAYGHLYWVVYGKSGLDGENR